jgi:RNA polymerase sigma-70 factor, ECF subfamily
MDTPGDRKRSRFEMLVVEHHVQLRIFVRSLAVNPDWVDDVAQEAFLRAYDKWDSFDQSQDFGKWIRGIAANIVRNEIRKDARHQRLLHTKLAEILLSRQFESRETFEPLSVEAIRECLGKLPQISRDIVHARYRDGQTAPELAIRLKLSAANVRQMLVRIRHQIKQCVELRMLKEAGYERQPI